jgi:hypothetical protein
LHLYLGLAWGVTHAGPIVTSFVLPEKVDYKKIAACNQMCRSTLRTATYPSLNMQKVDLEG